jgi:hypothetical protein
MPTFMEIGWDEENKIIFLIMPLHKVQPFLHQCLRTNILSSMLYEDVICQILLISSQKFRKQVQISVHATE